MIAEKLLGMNAAAAAIAIDAAQIKGVLPLPLVGPALDAAGVQEPGQQAQSRLADREQFRYSFGNALSEEESDELFERGRSRRRASRFRGRSRQLQPHSPAKVDTDNDERGPLLLIMGGKDHTVPRRSRSRPPSSTSTPTRSPTAGFEDRGHSLTVDSGWREVATCLEWLEKQGL